MVIVTLFSLSLFLFYCFIELYIFLHPHLPRRIAFQDNLGSDVKNCEVVQYPVGVKFLLTSGKDPWKELWTQCHQNTKCGRAWCV